MGFFDFWKRPDINEGVEQFQKTPGAVLLDVRTWEEYEEGHIPGSRLIPVDEMFRAPREIPERETPLFLYCHSGARSGQAAYLLRRMGYQNVTNIGGILGYRGKVE